MRYLVEKFSGRVYCGNAFFETLEECIKFADDNFCNRAIITELETDKKFKVYFE